MAGADTVLRVSGAPIGFAGPVGLKNCKIIADPEVVQITNAVTGANKNNYHLLNVNIQRDYHVHTVSDIRMVQAGEPCPRCGSPLVEAKGIEVGQIFKLGDKYSKVLGANYLDENGRSQPIIMGCYGIGVTRTMAAAIEQNHDKDGIIWPASIAPFDAVIIPVSTKDEAQVNLAEEIYNKLSAAGFDVLLDDRPERVGVKFKDADLIGYPLRLTVGSRTAAERQVEVRVRKTGEVTITSMNELEKRVRELLATI